VCSSDLREYYLLTSREPYFEIHHLAITINKFFKDMYRLKNAKSTISRAIYILNHYFQWAVDIGYLDRNPMKKVERIRLNFEDFTPSFMPEEFNFNEFLNRPDQFTFRGNNSRLIIFLLSAFGLKRSEVTQLRKGHLLDLDGDSPRLVIVKGIKYRTRVYALEPEAIREFEGFLARRRMLTEYELDEDDYLLQTNEHEKSHEPIDGSTLYRNFSKYLITESEKKMKPSSFRTHSVISSSFSRKYFELDRLHGMSHKEISKYKVLDAKLRLERESKELIEMIVKERVEEELKKRIG
jgi:site-specific recombinase XerD